jgi:hypothetical protein
VPVLDVLSVFHESCPPQHDDGLEPDGIVPGGLVGCASVPLRQERAGEGERCVMATGSAMSALSSVLAIESGDCGPRGKYEVYVMTIRLVVQIYLETDIVQT